MNQRLRQCVFACTAVFVGLLPAYLVEGQEGGPETPGKTHEILKSLQGTWEGTISFPGAPADAFKGAKYTETNTPILRGLWLRQQMKLTMPDGSTSEGVCMLGYDVLKKKVVACTTDDQRGDLQFTEGSFDVTGRVLTVFTSLPGRATGKIERTKIVDEIKDQDTRHQTQYNLEGPKEVVTVTMDLKRKK